MVFLAAFTVSWSELSVINLSAAGRDIVDSYKGAANDYHLTHGYSTHWDGILKEVHF
jgi:hypothetical protein